MRVISMRIPDDLLGVVDAMALADGRSRSGQIVWMLRGMIDGLPAPGKPGSNARSLPPKRCSSSAGKPSPHDDAVMAAAVGHAALTAPVGKPSVTCPECHMLNGCHARGCKLA